MHPRKRMALKNKKRQLADTVQTIASILEEEVIPVVEVTPVPTKTLTKTIQSTKKKKKTTTIKSSS